MTYFLRLNIVSFLYALMFFVPLELMLNVYRLARLTNIEVGTINTLTCLLLFVGTIGGTIVIYQLSKSWLKGRKANSWTILLWLPYFALLLLLFANLAPFTNEGDMPNPVTGLLAFGGIIVYPIYIFVINIFSMTNEE